MSRTTAAAATGFLFPVGRRYLLDADSFITSHKGPYRLAVCPGYWEWLETAHANGVVFSIDKVRAELLKRDDWLSAWTAARPDGFFLPANPDLSPSRAALSTWAYGAHYTQQAVDKFFRKADYDLVARAHQGGFIVVTHEVRDPTATGRVKVPDACDHLQVPCLNPYQMLEAEGARFILEKP